MIVSDRLVDKDRVAIPALLALSAIHRRLVNRGLRTSTGLVVETGSAREVHHSPCSAAMAPRPCVPTSRSKRCSRTTRGM